MTRRFESGHASPHNGAAPFALLLLALASCTTASQSPPGSPAPKFARYFFVEPNDVGVLEATSEPPSICYSTQSYPARPIVIIANANGGSRGVVSYAPGTGTFCDRDVSRLLVANLIADPSSYAVRWSPKANEPAIDSELITPPPPASG